ncbi:MAG: hypothetical protein WBN70_03770, partial [Polyangiales bacterium]
RETRFVHAEYTRDHHWHFEGGTIVEASSAPEYMGNENLVDPERAFVAALSSCHMLTFLALAARDGFVVDEYLDEPLESWSGMLKSALRSRGSR